MPIGMVSEFKMTIKDWLQDTTARFSEQTIPTARLDSIILLEDCLGIDRAHILARQEQELELEQIKWLEGRVDRRMKHEPLAYIRNTCEFYGRNFFVNHHVLVPRPETEPIISLVKEIPGINNMRIADIGAGSGCIGITIKLELPGTRVDMYDIDPTTFRVSKTNAKTFKADVAFYVSDLLESLVADYDLVIANLPYVPDGKPENVDVYFEPSHALFAGNDGLDLYRTFWRQLSILERKPTYIFTESRPNDQQEILTELADQAGYRLAITDNFVQKFELIR